MDDFKMKDFEIEDSELDKSLDSILDDKLPDVAAAAYVSDSSKMSETDDDNIMAEQIDSSDDDGDWRYLTDFGDDSKATYIGPRYDYIDDMITKYVFADNPSHQFFVQKIKSTTGVLEPFADKRVLQTNNRLFRELLQEYTGTEIPAKTDTKPIQSILYAGEFATPAEQFFMQVAHPFLQHYTDPEMATHHLELVPEILAFAFYVAFFSQARRPRTGEAQKREPPKVVPWLEKLYFLAVQKIEEMPRTSELKAPIEDYSVLGDVDDDAMSVENLITFFEWCVYSKLALVFLSKKPPDIELAESSLKLALTKATEDVILSDENGEKTTILQCIHNTQVALQEYQEYKLENNSRTRLKKAMRRIWVHPDSDFSNPTGVHKDLKLRFV